MSTQFQLPVISLAASALGAAWRKSPAILSLTWPYLLFNLALVFLPDSFNTHEGAQVFPAWREMGFYVLENIALGIVWTLTAVRLHRLFLLDSSSQSLIYAIKWTRCDTRFFLRVFVLSVLVGIALIISMGLSSAFVSIALFSGVEFTDAFLVAEEILVGILIVLPLAYIWARFALVLPSAALEKYQSFQWAWSTSKHFQWRLVWLVGLAPMLCFLVIAYISSLGLPVYLADLLATVLYLIVALVEISILSHCYQWITGQTTLEKPQEPEVV